MTARSGILFLITASLAASLAAGDERTRKLAQRLPEEAALFAREATKYASKEKLSQRALLYAQPIEGGLSRQAWRNTVVISRYGFVSFLTAPESLEELRQIVSIDGKRAKTSLKSVASAITASNDLQKRKLLEDFQKAGLSGVATGLGQLLLLFSARTIENYDFSFQSQRFIGADRVLVFTYAQVEGRGMTTYRGHDALHSKLSGEIWVDGDYRPLQVTLNSQVEAADKKLIRQEMEVQYAPGPYLCVLPTNARHRELHDGVLQAETLYEYSPFRPWEDK